MPPPTRHWTTISTPSPIGSGAPCASCGWAQRWSLGDLARASGLSKTILARIERGDGNPSVETLWRVSRALKVPLGALLSPPSRRPRVRAIRARSGEPLTADSGMDAWLLHAVGQEHRAELFDIELPRGTDQATDGHLPEPRS